MSERAFTGEALEKALGEGALDERPSGSEAFDAFVRQSEKEGHVSVGVAGCESFVDVPTALIENAEKLGYVPCGDHGHPQMRITLKVSDDPTARILSQLLAQKETFAAASRLPPNFDNDRPPGHGQVPSDEHGLSSGMGISLVGESPCSQTVPGKQEFNTGTVCSWRVLPCGFRLDPFRIIWCRAYICRIGGYGGTDVLVDYVVLNK